MLLCPAVQVTDMHEEKEMRSKVDKSKVQQAMAKLAAEQAAKAEATRLREKELAAVKARMANGFFLHVAVCLESRSAKWCSGNRKHIVVCSALRAGRKPQPPACPALGHCRNIPILQLLP